MNFNSAATRRNFCRLALGTAALGVGAHLGLYRTTAQAAISQAPGFFRFELGDLVITVISDGHLELPTTTLGANAERAAVEALLREHFLDTERTYNHTNHVLIDDGQHKLLVDVGSGSKFQPTAGKLVENMDAAEIAPEEITHVVLTHAHPDHVWGSLDDFGDEPRFPEAQHFIGATEFDWWMAEDRIASLPEAMAPFVVGAQNALRPLAEGMVMTKDGDEIIPGVRMIATPGHTVGHMSLLVESQGETLLITGDTITHRAISFEQPGWHFGFDTNPEQAAATRRKLLDQAATDRLLLVGYHLPFPGVGHVGRWSQGYRYLPAVWRWS